MNRLAHRVHFNSVLFCLLAAGGWLAAGSPARAVDRPAPARINFSREILPVLSDNCFSCHGPDEKNRKARLRLDTHEGALRVKDGVAVIAPGRSTASELVRRITSPDEDDVMPPPKSNRKLTPAQIELLKRWIDQGAEWGRHWAYEVAQRPAVPNIKNSKFKIQNPIDNFILARLGQEGLSPAPEAPRETLIRRVTLDLTGLPPTPPEVEAFLKDRSKDAYEKLVDRLLASPRYGERMVLEWLDAARYADSNGYQGDSTRTMWPWRDWVIDALNRNLPYDQFTIEQLAGDLLPKATREQKIATGFNRNHMINGEGGRIAEENRIDYLVDQTDTLATVWLGVTLGCARCHDHKFDPFTQKEYYQLLAYFNNTPVNGAGGSGQTKPVLDFTTPEDSRRLAELQAHIKDAAQAVEALEKDLFPREPDQQPAASARAAELSGNVINELKRSPAQRGVDGLREMINVFKAGEPKYADALAKLRKTIEERANFDAALPRVMVMEEMARPRDTFVLIKGAYDKPTDKVSAGVPAILPPLPAGAPNNRLALAKWLVAPENPLTARVTVNRYWQLFFGTGLVKTVDDFGVQGERPSHPELLDWLATEFMQGSARVSPETHPREAADGAWNVKRLIKMIVMSATYRQSSKVTPALLERDPANRLLARGPRFRLSSFALRDQALYAGGLLVEKTGGPPVRPYQPPGIWEEATFGKISYQQDHGENLYRRSLYTFWRRIVGPTMFFDSASRQNCTVKAQRTNTPLHALATLNDITYVEAARALAERVMLAAPKADARIETAFRLATSRKPTGAEKKILLRRLHALQSQYAADPDAAFKLLQVGESKRNEKLDAVEHAAYTGVCSLVLNLDETITKE